MKYCLALLLAAPAGAQFRAAPVKAPTFAPGLSAPALIAPVLSGPGPTAALARPMTLTPSLPSAMPGLAAPILPAAQVKAAALPTSARSAEPASLFSPPGAALSAVKEASPEGGEARGPATVESAERLGRLFDGAGKLAGDLRAPQARSSVDLRSVPTDATPRVSSEKKAGRRLERDLKRIQKYQEMLFARGERAVVLVFQGMDTGGKDGVIKTVVGAMNPQGVRVTSFKKPTKEEAAQHYLTRIKKALPEPGGVGVLNRSHYEDIVVPSVLGTHPSEEIEVRTDEINEFERALAEKGVIVLKFFMHISKDEQKRRLQDRLDRPEKNWKFSPSDLESRKKWDAYQKAWGKVLARTNKPWAPWFVIPADNKWYRDYAVGRILRKTLDRLGLSYPPGPKDPHKIVIPD